MAFVYLFLFLFGLIVGSFLNVLVLRTSSGENLKGRSRCFSCLKKLSWLDLFPVVSFLSIRGRCRYCGSKISWQYPIVELMSGIIFVSVAWVMMPALPDLLGLVRYLLVVAFFSMLLAISVYDIRHKIIPDSFSIALFVFVAILEGIHIYEQWGFVGATWFSDVIAGVGAFSFFGGLWLASRGKWMGLGDAKIAISIGLLLGFPGVLFGLLISFWVGALYGLSMMALHRYSRKSEVPFAPFLAIGAYATFFIISTDALMVLYRYLGLYGV